MKRKLPALLCALALILSLAGCVISTPDTVGTIGDVEITSGLYLLAQYNAYQSAANLASSDQDAANVKSFLKETITTDPDSGETATVSDYVADQTQKNLDLYAAVESRFDELGGQLTEAEESQADSYASQLMDQYADTYKANGIGLETLKRFERILLKSNDLLELVYGQNGETPVSDADLTSHLETSMYELAYYTVPLYNTSTYAFADDDQKAEMLSLAQAVVDSYNATAPDDAAAQFAAFNAAASNALSGIYAVLDSTVPADSTTSLQTELLGSSTLDSTFTAEGSADAIRALHCGDAVAVQYSSLSLIMAVRLDPLDGSSLDAVRSQVLSDLKSDELADALADYGASMEHHLDAPAMNKLSPLPRSNRQARPIAEILFYRPPHMVSFQNPIIPILIRSNNNAKAPGRLLLPGALGVLYDHRVNLSNSASSASFAARTAAGSGLRAARS